VKCGKEEQLYENLCKDCFLEKATFFEVPKVIKTIICPHCLARAVGNHWEDSMDEETAIKNSVIDNIKMIKEIDNDNYLIELEPFKTNILTAKIQAIGDFENLEVMNELITEVRLNYKSCFRCSRLSGSYYEAILQLRATNRHLTEDEMKKAEEIVLNYLDSGGQTEPYAFLTKSEYIHGGVDFYIGSSNIARQIAKVLAAKFKGKVRESSSLVGRHDGKEVHRITSIIRIPEYKVGEFIKYENKIYRIHSMHKNHVICIYLQSGQKVKFDHAELSNANILGGSELTNDAVVVFESENEIQILDPDTYKTIDVLKPKDFRVKGESVKVLKYEDQIYII
jgi:nonsense-mediated mRNA decay protein 3